MIRAILPLALAIGTAAGAGEGNRASIQQLSPTGSLQGNVLILDQSGARGSILTGVPLGAEADAATQSGEGNHAYVTLTGDGATAQLLQAGNTNSATILAATAATASLSQIGLGNAASMVLAPHASALVSQTGNGNLVSDLNVGHSGSAVLSQTGNGNDTGAITVAPGASLHYAQEGNGLGPVGAGVQVLISTAPAAISITQTGW